MCIFIQSASAKINNLLAGTSGPQGWCQAYLWLDLRGDLYSVECVRKNQQPLGGDFLARRGGVKHISGLIYEETCTVSFSCSRTLASPPAKEFFTSHHWHRYISFSPFPGLRRVWECPLLSDRALLSPTSPPAKEFFKSHH